MTPVELVAHRRKSSEAESVKAPWWPPRPGARGTAVKTLRGRGTGPRLARPSWRSMVPFILCSFPLPFQLGFLRPPLTAYQLTCPARPSPESPTESRVLSFPQEPARARPAMTYTECKTVTLVTRSGGRMTTVYLNGEGQRVAVVEERQGEEAVNPWESMSPEAVSYTHLTLPTKA